MPLSGNVSIRSRFPLVFQRRNLVALPVLPARAAFLFGVRVQVSRLAHHCCAQKPHPTEHYICVFIVVSAIKNCQEFLRYFYMDCKSLGVPELLLSDPSGPAIPFFCVCSTIRTHIRRLSRLPEPPASLYAC